MGISQALRLNGGLVKGMLTWGASGMGDFFLYIRTPVVSSIREVKGDGCKWG